MIFASCDDGRMPSAPGCSSASSMVSRCSSLPSVIDCTLASSMLSSVSSIAFDNAGTASSRISTQRSMGRYAVYASRRVRTIRAVRKSETTSDQSSPCRHVRLSRKHNAHNTQPSKESYGERTDDTVTHKLELVTCGSHYTNHHIKKLQHRKTASKKLGRREYRSTWS